jgi:hypothetical protein
MNMITGAWYTVRRWVRERMEPRGPLCDYLGCGQYATRVARDRVGNLIPACPDSGHGRSVEQ